MAKPPPRSRRKKKRREPLITTRWMTEEELDAAQNRMYEKRQQWIRQKQQERAALAKDLTLAEAKRQILSGETFASQKPSDYRRKIKRK
jgi:multidrug resistance efflux pump